MGRTAFIELKLVSLLDDDDEDMAMLETEIGVDFRSITLVRPTPDDLTTSIVHYGARDRFRIASPYRDLMDKLNVMWNEWMKG